MKAYALFCSLLIACGQETVVVDTSKSSGQAATDASASVSVDLQSFYDATCPDKPLTWSCAKWCVNHKDSSWCGAYDVYCAGDEGRDDPEFCNWWTDAQ